MMRIIKWLSRKMIDPIIGKIIGITLIIVPILFIFQIGMTFSFNFTIISILKLIIYSYLGLFLGGFIHECGHVVTLRLMGVNSTISIMKNPHSRIIFFNMRTNIVNEHPIQSTSNRLLLRGLSGFFGNMFAYIIFLSLGLYFKNPILLYLAAIQGFSGHGATSLTDLDGDTDVRTLREGLSIKDEIFVIEIVENEQNLYDIKINLEIKDQIAKNYWIIVNGIEIKKYNGDFLSFDMGPASLFVLGDMKTGEWKLKIWGETEPDFNIITKNDIYYSK